MAGTSFASATSAVNRATWPTIVQTREPILVCGGFLADPDASLILRDCVFRSKAADAAGSVQRQIEKDAVESQINLLRQALQLA